MANCPNCGSNHIQLTTETNVDWGRAAVGWAFFGVVGGAVGAVTGDDRKAIICLDCGTSWKPAQLHKIVTSIEDLINVKIDLEKANHRAFVNNFIEKISPYIDTVKQTEENHKNLCLRKNKSIENVKNPDNSNNEIGCLIVIIIFVAIFNLIFENLVIPLIIAFILVSWYIYHQYYVYGKISEEEKITNTEKYFDTLIFEEETKMMNAKDKLNIEIQNLLRMYPLD